MKAKKPCLLPGCTNLVDSGYCQLHKRYAIKNKKETFKQLDDKKDPETIKFYRSAKWTKTSRIYRNRHPLCERCIKNNIVQKAELVHHTVDLKELLKEKLNPLSYRYLEAICENHHLEELRLKKLKKT